MFVRVCLYMRSVRVSESNFQHVFMSEVIRIIFITDHPPALPLQPLSLSSHSSSLCFSSTSLSLLMPLISTVLFSLFYNCLNMTKFKEIWIMWPIMVSYKLSAQLVTLVQFIFPHLYTPPLPPVFSQTLVSCLIQMFNRIYATVVLLYSSQGSVSLTCSPSLSSAELIMGSSHCRLPQRHKLICSSHSQVQQQASLGVVTYPPDLPSE